MWGKITKRILEGKEQKIILGEPKEWIEIENSLPENEDQGLKKDIELEELERVLKRFKKIKKSQVQTLAKRIFHEIDPKYEERFTNTI